MTNPDVGSGATCVNNAPANVTLNHVTFNSVVAITCRCFASSPGDRQVTAHDLTSWFGGSWTSLDPTGTGGAGSALGINWTVAAPSANNGSWRLAWDTTGSPGLPLTMDPAVVIKTANPSTVWVFNALDFIDLGRPGALDNTGSGWFDIDWTNKGGNQPNLLHMTLFGSSAKRCTTVPSCAPPPPPPNGCLEDCGPPPVSVPEPGTLSPLGLCLPGLGFGVRQRRKA